jgi:hypothetical protein
MKQPDSQELDQLLTLRDSDPANYAETLKNLANKYKTDAASIAGFLNKHQESITKRGIRVTKDDEHIREQIEQLSKQLKHRRWFVGLFTALLVIMLLPISIQGFVWSYNQLKASIINPLSAEVPDQPSVMVEDPEPTPEERAYANATIYALTVVPGSISIPAHGSPQQITVTIQAPAGTQAKDLGVSFAVNGAGSVNPTGKQNYDGIPLIVEYSVNSEAESSVTQVVVQLFESGSDAVISSVAIPVVITKPLEPELTLILWSSPDEPIDPNQPLAITIGKTTNLRVQMISAGNAIARNVQLRCTLAGDEAYKESILEMWPGASRDAWLPLTIDNLETNLELKCEASAEQVAPVTVSLTFKGQPMQIDCRIPDQMYPNYRLTALRFFNDSSAKPLLNLYQVPIYTDNTIDQSPWTVDVFFWVPRNLWNEDPKNPTIGTFSDDAVGQFPYMWTTAENGTIKRDEEHRIPDTTNVDERPSIDRSRGGFLSGIKGYPSQLICDDGDYLLIRIEGQINKNDESSNMMEHVEPMK